MKNIFLYIVLISGYSFAQGETLRVGPNSQWQEIGDAICEANPGDSIIVEAGLYREGNIIIDKPLTIRGENHPVLDGNHQTEILTIVANGVTIEGLTIQNVGTSYIEDRAGIRVKNSRDFIIRNNRLIDTFFGIYLEHARDGIIINNTIEGQAIEEMSSGNGIHLWYCKSILVEGNQVTDHRDGIYLEFVDESRIVHNFSENNLRYGLHFMFSNDDEYADNTFRDNGAGVAVMFSRRINMVGNTFENNWGSASYGLLLKEIYDAEIENNTFRQNTIGIYVEGSTRVNYFKNEFIRNGWAVKISGGCMNNDINQNNFIGNTFDMAIRTKMSENNFDGNYWSEYSGYDLDKDGVGDIPFRPVKLFSYIVNRSPESLVLLRSLFVDILNFSEKVSPVFTPTDVQDHSPSMKPLSFASPNHTSK